MKVVLINPPIETKSRLWYPIGIAYIATCLRQNGIEVTVIDLIGEDFSRKEFINRLNKENAEYFGIGGIVTAFNNFVDIAGYIRDVHPNAFIFAGNTVAYTIPEIILGTTTVNAVVMGEGEDTVVDLVTRHYNGDNLQNVYGIMYKDEEGNIITTEPRKPIDNIDMLSYPAWDLLPLENYFKNAKHRYCVISTVRGCPYNCTFCCKTFLNYKTRYRCAESIIDELVEFNNRYNISRFYFFDDLSMVYKANLIKFCQLKMESPLAAMPWTISGRLSTFDDELASALKAANVSDIGFGIESLDQDVLDLYNKNLEVEQIHKAIEICEKHQLSYAGSSFLIGAINETEKSVKSSVEFCRQHNLRYEPHFVTPFPGTELYSYAIEQGLIKDEVEYLRKMSAQGNTDYLLVNLTKNFSDEELIALRADSLYFPNNPTLNPPLLELITLGLDTLRKNPLLFLERAKNFILNRINPYRGNLHKYGNEWL
jgi:anaerobic magnesium-protoporphyrin IX monomethyl ester cyclase